MKLLLGVFGFIFFALIAVILLVNRGPATSSNSAKPPTGVVRMTSFADKSVIVSHTTTGRLVGDTERRSVRVSVTPTERRIEILSGYDQNVIRSQSYPNSKSGYENFLSALDLAGFTKTKKPSVTDDKGVCPGGNQYFYNVEGSGTSIRSWSTSCASSEGTFAGNAASMRQLFRDQIPDYSNQLKDVRL